MPEPLLATTGNPPTQILRDGAGRTWIAEGDRIELIEGTRRRGFSARKDLALQAIAYGNVYVAQIAMGANPQQTL